jgi:hypothetical protein
MAGNINEFKASFTTDLAKPSKFDVTIPVPLALATYITTGRNLSMRCESVDMPGRTFATTDRKMGSAPVEKIPYQTTYGESTFTFIVSDNMNEKIFFDAWMELINPTTDFNFQYKANYAVDVSINQYDVTNNLTYATAIGYNAKVQNSYTIQLGSTSVTNVKTSGTYTAGAVTYPKVDGTAGQVLTANANGIPTWQTIATSPLVSPNFTGTPTAPTATAGTNTISVQAGHCPHGCEVI